MIVSAWANTEDKYEFTFTLYNSDEDDSLNIDEFTIIVKCFLNGFRRWAHKRPLSDDELLPLAKMLFEKIDIDYSGEVDMKEVSDVLKNLPEVRDVFLMYEKGRDATYPDSVLKKRLTMFAVYKLNFTTTKKTSKIKCEENINISPNKKEAIKHHKSNNMIRKPTQEKLKCLYSLYIKILDT